LGFWEGNRPSPSPSSYPLIVITLT
jgi:hypothetical protein